MAELNGKYKNDVESISIRPLKYLIQRGTMRTKRGRKSKLTPETREKMLSLIRTGGYFEDACKVAGIDSSTFRRWMQKGAAQTRGKYRTFRTEVKKAEAEAKTRFIANIDKAAGAGTWQASAWMLERRWPEQFARRDGLAIDAKVEHSGEVKHELDVAIKADPAIARLLAEASNRYFYALRGGTLESSGSCDSCGSSMDTQSSLEPPERLRDEADPGRHPVLTGVDAPETREE